MARRIALLFPLLLACGKPSGPTAFSPDLPVDTLRVVLALGEELGDSTVTFGVIQDALLLPDGGFLVLDRQVPCVKVYDARGSYLRQVSRRGSGPGELGMPWDILRMPDGRVLVLDMMKQGFVVFDDSLRFVEEFGLWPQNPPLQASPLSDSTFAAYKIDVDMVNEFLVMRRRIAAYTLGNRDFDLVLREDSLKATMDQLMENPSMFIIDLLDAFCLGGDGEGTVYFAEKSGETYLVLGWDAAGREVFRVSMNLDPVPKTPEEILEEQEYMTNFLNNMGSSMPFTFQPEPYRNMVVNLGVGPDGNVWVLRGTQDTPFFDIFDGNGNPVRHAVFPVEGWSWTFVVSPQGILAWELDPVEGYQRLYVLE